MAKSFQSAKILSFQKNLNRLFVGFEIIHEMG